MSSNLGAVSGGPSYWPLFYLLPSVSGEETVYGSLLSSVSQSPWLSVSEKERIEQLLLSGSLVIPPPQINIAAFQNIALNFPDFFNICLVGGAEGLGSFGAVESAVTLAALGAWAKSHHITESDLVQAFSTSGNVNPFQVALTEYIEKSEIKGVDANTMQLLLRQLVALHAALKTAPEDTVLKAFTIAYQQLIIAFLQKWSESLNELAELQKQAMKEQELRNAEKMREILKDYIQNAELKREQLQQPILSIIFGSFLIDSTIMQVVTPLFPAFSVGSVFSFAPELSATLNVLALGLLGSALMWAAPVAMAMTTRPLGLSEQQVMKDAASSFARTIASLVTNESFTTFLLGLLPEGKASIVSATYKASMLLVGMALLYKSNMGGVSGKELQAIITGEITVGPDDFLGVLAKLIKEQLSSVPEKDRERLLAELVSPYDHSLSIEQIVSPLTSFILGWNPQLIRDTVLANRG